jgi:hypothetical protein
MNILAFNKLSKVFVLDLHGEMDGVPVVIADLDTTFFIYKEVESFDHETQRWKGDYDTGSIVDIEDLPEIAENQLDKQAENKIKSKVSIGRQLNMAIALLEPIITTLNTLADDAGKPELKLDTNLISDAKDMRDYIQKIRDNNNRYKDFYKESDDYEFLSKNDEFEMRSKQLDGGIHEIIGNEKEGVGFNN